MANLVYKRLFKLALAVLLAGCASEPVTYHAEYPGHSNRQTNIPPVNNPAHQPIRQYPDSYTRLPYSNSYGAQTLTGTYANSFAVRNFIQHMVHKHGFSESYLKRMTKGKVLLLFRKRENLNFGIDKGGEVCCWRTKLLS